ncbi:DEAD/DEAH box helicase [Demequina sp.]|uniref:DEAD/DEAH box helicase n=1 Tax=Demequina sp. TaxID=2050685 RepID=UPI003A87C540
MSSDVTPGKLAEGLRDAFLRYYDTAYWLNDPDLMAERRALLEAPDAIVGDVLLEPVLPYPNSVPIGEAAERAGIATSTLESVARATFGVTDVSDVSLRAHQANAIERHFSAAAPHNVVVTSGTGSGKTESFLFPILARLVEESKGWASQPAANRWWSAADPRWVPMRHGESRPGAVRTLILYPTNALVEDQMTRMRRAIRALNAEHPERPLWFGRYTGSTLGNQHKPTKKSKKAQEVAKELCDLAEDYAKVLAAAQSIAEQSVEAPSLEPAEFPDPATGEMMTRWDMIDSPPDVLVTNYSMLNTMMMRAFEDPIFASTQEWVKADSSHVFTLVVDELHLYRGTQGSEVALIIRQLLNRLGIEADSPQLRIIATSASLDEGESSLSYLEEFFGTDRRTFAIDPGQPLQVPSDPGSWTAEEVAGASAAELTHAIAAACREPGSGRIRATSTNVIAERMFGRGTESISVFEAVFDRLADDRPGEDGVTLIPMRAHVFVRAPRGMWACTNRACSGVSEAGSDRTVGTLYPAPRAVCDHCGSRVLDLLYCFHCGDVSLGGNVVETKGEDTLISSLPTTERQAERPVFRKAGGEYVWFRPGTSTTVDDWSAGKTKFGFRPLAWNPSLGLAQPSLAATDALRLVPLGAGPASNIPALPTKCPTCGMSERQGNSEVFQSGVVRSPIRAHTAGSAAATQLYLSELVRALATGKEGRGAVVDAKTIIFTDSRDDAARTAAGVALNHHRDLVRQVLRREVHRAPDPFALLGAISGPDEADARGLLAGWQANMMLNAKIPLSPEMQAALDDAVARLSGEQSISLLQLFDRVQDALLEIGVNPGGPSPWNVTLEDGSSATGTPWYRAFEPPVKGAWPGNPTQYGRERLLRDMRRSVAESLFDGARRDMESVGIARLSVAGVEAIDGPLAHAELLQVVDSSIRILGTRRRYADSLAFGVEDEDLMVKPVRDYVEAVARHLGLDEKASVAQVDALFGTEPLQLAARKWILTTGSFETNLVAVPAGGEVWRCKNCRYVHLQPSAGVCANTQCNAAQLEVEPARDAETDYYAWLANKPSRRLAIAELTGQTRPLSLQRERQRRFKGALAPSEHLLPDELDALSVTTTMEVGVDIGSLRSTMMANVPPQRFNYQQRVGRAGRSGQALSFALTLCRDRTHDDFYFQRPERITGDIPPQPFLDLGRRAIIQRGVNSECLRLAFGSLSDPPQWGPESSHGTFGTVETWPNFREAIGGFLRASDTVDRIAVRASRYTRLDEAEVANVVQFARSALVVAIDEVIAREGDGAEGELSALLARRGLLPIFGFPTRVRSLYDGMPWNQDALQRMVVSDRPLGQAISAFAPGAEVVKDGKVHTAVGFVGFNVQGSVVKPVENPLGPVTSVAKCERCGRTELRPKAELNVCEQCDAPLVALGLYEPRGFRTSYKPRSYDDRNDDQSHASPPEISVQAKPDRRAELGPIDLEVYEQAPLVSFNDNGGAGYKFVNEEDGSVTVVPGQPQAEVKNVIGEIRVTDALLVTPRRLSLKTGSLGLLEQWSARAAYTSVAEAMKLAAQAHLDLDAGELAVGLNPVRVPMLADDQADMKSQVASAIYFADTAENGAGYAIEIGEPETFEQVLAHAVGDLQSRWAAPTHAAQCDVSCPDCMRSYDNSRKHPLLDWRLALDMLELLSGRELTLGRSLRAGDEVYEVAARALPGAEARAYGEVPAIVAGRKCVLLAHPLWRVEEAWLDDAQAVAQVQAQTMDGLYVEWFDARRFRLNPVSVMSMLQS